MRSTEENEAFSAFYRRHADFVYGIALSFLRVPADAEDAAADVFLKILETDMRFEDDAHARAWLTVAVRNRCKNLLKSWVRTSRTEIDQLSEPAEEQPDSRLSETLTALYGLPERYRLPLLLFAVQGFSVTETASILKLKESTVRTRIQRARKLLRKALERRDAP